MKQPMLAFSSFFNTISTNKEKSREDKIPPCFTPDNNGTRRDKIPPHLITVKFLPNQFSKILITLISIFFSCSIHNKPKKFTLSNDFFKSITPVLTVLFLLLK